MRWWWWWWWWWNTNTRVAMMSEFPFRIILALAWMELRSRTSILQLAAENPPFAPVASPSIPCLASVNRSRKYRSQVRVQGVSKYDIIMT